MTPRGLRSGFTVVELVAALSILAMAMVLVAQLSVFVWGERSRAAADVAALELAANTLETARATPWDQLTSAWAAAQTLPAPFAERGWRLHVTIEQEAGRPNLRRVAVEVERGGERGARPVRLVALFAARSLGRPGGVV